jgi:acyl-CoA thioesterase I
VIAKPEAEAMVDLIASAAKRENVALFRGFAVMRHWRQDEHIEAARPLRP